VSSGFGRELTEQLLLSGDRVLGTVRRPDAVADVGERYPDTFHTAILDMLDPANGLAPGDPARMAARIIETVDVEPAPLRLVLGSQALDSTLATLQTRIAGFEAQRALAQSTDFPPEE
jgi:NAD(P)-dependent dehydrogenase (short-subunit alcohol dehydrogenase family)